MIGLIMYFISKYSWINDKWPGNHNLNILFFVINYLFYRNYKIFSTKWKNHHFKLAIQINETILIYFSNIAKFLIMYIKGKKKKKIWLALPFTRKYDVQEKRFIS